MFRRKGIHDWADPKPNRSLYLLAALLCVLAGQLVSVSGPKVSILFISGLAGIVLIMQPLMLMWLTTIVTLLISGMVIYFAQGLNVSWGGYGLAAMLYGATILTVFGEGVRAPRSRLGKADSTHDGSGHDFLTINTAIIIFFAIALFTIALNQAPIFTTVAAVKSYFLYGGIWTALAFISFEESVIKKWLQGLLVVGLVQWPVALYQYLFVRAARIQSGLGTVEASDSVVGTFGGSQESGGLTAVLALYLVVVLTVLWALYRDKQLSGTRFLILAGVLSLPLVLMEVKVVFFYLPVALFFLYRDFLYKRPAVFLGGCATVAVLLGLLLFAYQAFHWSAKSDDMEGNMLAVFSYSFSEDMAKRMAERGELSRRSVLEFWLRENSRGDYLKTIVGHGLGATRYTEINAGHIAKKYFPAEIYLTGLSVLLWETGLLGVAAFFFLMFCAFRSAGKVMQQAEPDSWRLGLARGLQATVPLYVMALAYRADIPQAGPMMFLFMGHLGLISWLRRQGRVDAS